MVYHSTHKALSKNIPIHKSGYQIVKFENHPFTET
ncbi:hypothetical protein CHRYSEOSP005_08060 [Chryseobacterium sp. Alg-005]